MIFSSLSSGDSCRIALGLHPKNHDLPLPDWGPYGKRYAGVSHVADKKNGLRFDLSVFPSLYRRRTDVPSALWESGWHPWSCGARFDYFSFRHEIIWKDQVYADISYSALPDGLGCLIRSEIVNQTRSACPVALHLMAAVEYPSPWTNSTEPLRRLRPALPENSILKHPLDYEEIRFARSEATDGLGPDGLIRGEIPGQDFLDGSALGGRFGRERGDAVTYRFHLDEPMPGARLVLFGRSTATRSTSEWLATLPPDGAEARLRIEGNESKIHEIALGDLPSGDHEVALVSQSDDSTVEIVFLAITPEAADMPLHVACPRWVPEHIPGSGHRSLILKYPDVPRYYGIAWEAESFEIRQILHHELDSFLRSKTHDHVHETLNGDGQGHFTNVFIRPIVVPPVSRSDVWALVCAGNSPREVDASLSAFAGGVIDRQKVHAEAKKKAFAFHPVESGEVHAFGQNLMAATTLTNIVFPIYTQRQYIRHRTPGRLWDSLYTWDAGFIGLGLLEIDPVQAEENLAQYLTEPGNSHAAFIHHGSMVPMQIHLYQELWNRVPSFEFLERHYDAVRQYYRFFAGHTPGSTMRDLKSGLLRSWDYFYNSGGWDDYPPQKFVHTNGLADCVTAASLTAQAIRCAKSLSRIADLLGRGDHVEDYRRDIIGFSDALQNLAWDSEAGYFSYVTHNAGGNPEGILRHASGANFNMGLDGIYPLVGGICDAKQESLLIERLFDPARLWTALGLTAVDQSAPYYHRDGYWVGTVWIAHQWFFWKTLLDLDRPDLSLRIATAVLNAWSRETGESYNCCEHFLIESGRGCGWHQFSGLSTPVLIFFASCYCPGRLTVGFDVLPLEYRFTEGNTAFRGRLVPAPRDGGGRRSILARMSPEHAYSVCWNGQNVPAEPLLPGLLAISLPAEGREGLLEVLSE